MRRRPPGQGDRRRTEMSYELEPDDDQEDPGPQAGPGHLLTYEIVQHAFYAQIISVSFLEFLPAAPHPLLEVAQIRYPQFR